MDTILLIIVLLILFGGFGGGYYGYSHYGMGGGIGILGVVLIIVLLPRDIMLSPLGGRALHRASIDFLEALHASRQFVADRPELRIFR